MSLHPEIHYDESCDTFVTHGLQFGLTFGSSGLPATVPFGFPNQGEHYSLNDYDGNKLNIVPDRYAKVKTELEYMQLQQLLRAENRNSAREVASRKGDFG